MPWLGRSGESLNPTMATRLALSMRSMAADSAPGDRDGNGQYSGLIASCVQSYSDGETRLLRNSGCPPNGQCRRNQKGPPKARAQVPPRREQEQQGSGGKVQGSAGGVRRSLRAGQAAE